MPILHRFTVAKIVVAIALLLAFAQWPYAYYQLLRWAVCGLAVFSAFEAHEKQRNLWLWAFVVLAILFNPIIPIHFTREVWQVLDVGAAVVLFVSLFFHQPSFSSPPKHADNQNH
jgi:hypothetical protein